MLYRIRDELLFIWYKTRDIFLIIFVPIIDRLMPLYHRFRCHSILFKISSSWFKISSSIPRNYHYLDHRGNLVSSVFKPGRSKGFVYIKPRARKGLPSYVYVYRDDIPHLFAALSRYWSLFNSAPFYYRTNRQCGRYARRRLTSDEAAEVFDFYAGSKDKTQLMIRRGLLSPDPSLSCYRHFNRPGLIMPDDVSSDDL